MRDPATTKTRGWRAARPLMNPGPTVRTAEPWPGATGSMGIALVASLHVGPRSTRTRRTVAVPDGASNRGRELFGRRRDNERWNELEGMADGIALRRIRPDRGARRRAEPGSVAA